jgi:hypothetical protein
MQPKSKPTAWTSDLFSIGGTITKTYKHPSVTEGAEDKYQTFADPKVNSFGEGKSMASVSFSLLYAAGTPEVGQLVDQLTESLFYRRNTKGELVANKACYTDDMARGLVKALIKAGLTPMKMVDWEAAKNEQPLQDLMSEIELDGIDDLNVAINEAVRAAVDDLKVTLTKTIGKKSHKFRALTPVQQILPTDKNTKKFREPYVDFVCDRPDDLKTSNLAGYVVETKLTLRLSLGFKDGTVRVYKQFNVKDMAVIQTNDGLPRILAEVNQELSALYIERGKEAKMAALSEKYKNGASDVMGISFDDLAAEYDDDEDEEEVKPKAKPKVKANVKKKVVEPDPEDEESEEEGEMWGDE